MGLVTSWYPMFGKKTTFWRVVTQVCCPWFVGHYQRPSCTRVCLGCWDMGLTYIQSGQFMQKLRMYWNVLPLSFRRVNALQYCKMMQKVFCDWPHSWRNGFNLDALLFQLSLPLEGTRHHDDFIENRRHHDTPQNLVVDHHFGTHFGWMNPHVPAIFGVRHLLHWGADRGRILHAYYEERWSAWFSKTGWWNNRRKFRSQTSDNMDRWKAEMGRVREEKRRRKKIKEEKVRRKKIQVREKVGKSRNTVFFPMICGSNSRLAKAAGAEPAGQMRDEKLHAVVARSTFPSQNVQNTPFSDQFWKLRCRKNARRCGAKLIFWHTILGPLLEVDMLKKCTPLWLEAHFEVKSAKNWGLRATFAHWDVVLRGRRRGFCTLSKVSKT